MSFAVLHTGDLHYRSDFLAEIERCVAPMIIAASRADLIVIAGDIFHHGGIKLEDHACQAAIKLVERLACHAPVVIIRGNLSHDGHALHVFDHLQTIHQVLVAERPGQYLLSQIEAHGFVEAEPDGQFDLDEAMHARCLLSLLPMPTKEWMMANQAVGSIQDTNDQAAKGLSAIMAGFGVRSRQVDEQAARLIPHVLISHLTVTGSMNPAQPITGIEIEVPMPDFDLARANLVCLGHIHERQQIGENIFYCGSPYRANYGVGTEPKGFWLHEISNHDDEILVGNEFLPVPATRRPMIEVDLKTGELDIQKISAIIAQDEAPINLKVRLLAGPDQHVDRFEIEQQVRKANPEIGGLKIEIQREQAIRVRADVSKITGLPERIKTWMSSRDPGFVLSESVTAKAKLLESDLEKVEEQVCGSIDCG